MFDSILVKLLSILTVLFFLSSSIVGYLYHDSLKTIGSLESKQIELKQALEDATKGKETLIISNKQDDTISTLAQEEIKNLQSKNTDLLKQLKNIPTKRCPINTPIEEAHEADIDDKLPDDLIQLLK